MAHVLNQGTQAYDKIRTSGTAFDVRKPMYSYFCSESQPSNYESVNILNWSESIWLYV